MWLLLGDGGGGKKWPDDEYKLKVEAKRIC